MNSLSVKNGKVSKITRQRNCKKITRTIKSSYKVFVFDLDDTLYMHSLNENDKTVYHEQVKIFLESLYNSGKIICIATHNKNPYNYLEKLNIVPLFDHIIWEQKNVNPIFNTIYDYTGKDEMIKELVGKIGCTIEDIVFFDDSKYNIDVVKSIDVASIHVSNKTGIVFKELAKNDINLSRGVKWKLTFIKNKFKKQQNDENL